MTTTVLTGIICNNTCIGFQDGDNTPDIYGLFGGGELTGPFKLTLGSMTDSLTINGHTLTFAASHDPHFSIVTNSPILSSFASGAVEFVASSLYSPAGFAGPETEVLCPVTAVPEPATWALMLLGFGFLMWRKRCGIRLAS